MGNRITLNGMSLLMALLAAGSSGVGAGEPTENVEVPADVPRYAVIGHDPDPRSCVDGAPLTGGALTTATWNPAQILSKLAPFGLRISPEVLEELVQADPAAALVVAQRLVRNGKVAATPDMHQGELRPAGRPVAVKIPASGSPHAGEIRAEFEPLGAGEEMTIRYRTTFGAGGRPAVIVESWTIESGVPDLRDFSRTVIELDPADQEELPVIASDDFPAPVYRVARFAVDRGAS